MRRARAAVVGAALVAGVLAACGSPDPVALPDVVGIALDDAHRTFEAAGLEEFDDVDHVEDRSVLMDSNWVVIEQSPAPGTLVEPSTTIELRVAKIDDEGTAALLPDGSPVLADLRARQERDATRAAEDAAAEEARAAEEASAAAAELTAYVERLDPPMRIATQLISGVDDFAGSARAGLDELSFEIGADTAQDAADALVDGLDGNGPPRSAGRADAYTQLEDAAEAVQRAAATLASAKGTTKDSSLARYDEIWAAAVPQWNAALVALYEGTGVTPPQVS